MLKGFHVTIIAKHLPGDTDIFYASNWAGAAWGGKASDAAERHVLAATYRHQLRLARTEPTAGVCVSTTMTYMGILERG